MIGKDENGDISNMVVMDLGKLDQVGIICLQKLYAA